MTLKVILRTKNKILFNNKLERKLKSYFKYYKNISILNIGYIIEITIKLYCSLIYCQIKSTIEKKKHPSISNKHKYVYISIKALSGLMC